MISGREPSAWHGHMQHYRDRDKAHEQSYQLHAIASVEQALVPWKLGHFERRQDLDESLSIYKVYEVQYRIGFLGLGDFVKEKAVARTLVWRPYQAQSTHSEANLWQL